MNKEQALGRLLAAKNFRDICPDTVKKEFEIQLARRGDPSAAEKAARERLHAVTGAFMTPGEARAARACLDEYLSGDESALTRALRLHASTRERLEWMDALFSRVLSFTGGPSRVFDAACGLNPLYLGHLGLKGVLGWDIHGGAVKLINDWARACGWDVRAECRDVILSAPDETFGLALAMKLLPVLETGCKGSALTFLKSLKARFILVTFPTRTLGGRNVGMERTYSDWFASEIAGHFEIAEVFTAGSELCYILKEA